MISIDGLRFEYPRSRFVLEIESLRIDPGEKVAFVGPSGSGKTTLLNLIAGIASPRAGKITVDDRSLNEMSDGQRRDFRASQIGLVFQQFELLPYLRTRDNIRLPFLINQALSWSDETTDRLRTLASATGILDKLSRFPRQLSQGEQQRVAIARALINRPRLVLADEPTGNLDSANKQLVLQLLFDQLTSVQGTLVVVTHDVGILEGFDRVVDFAQFHRPGADADQPIRHQQHGNRGTSQ